HLAAPGVPEGVSPTRRDAGTGAGMNTVLCCPSLSSRPSGKTSRVSGGGQPAPGVWNRFGASCGIRGCSSSVARWVRDEEAAGSNPANPTEKFQVDGMIAKRGDHAIDRWLVIRWRDTT